MRKYVTMLMLIAVFAVLSGCGGSHHHKPSEAAKFSDDVRVKN